MSAEPPFDFVISNPPYVSEAEFNELDTQVRDHEPSVALLAGEHGTDVIARLIPQAADRLAVGGWLIMEISPMIKQRVLDLVTSDGRYATPNTVRDLAQLARVVVVQKKG